MRIAIFEAVRHPVTVGVPIGGAVQQAIAVHVPQEPCIVHGLEGSDERDRLNQGNVALFAGSDKDVHQFGGHLDDVVDQVLVGVPRCGVCSVVLLKPVWQTVLVGVEDAVARVLALGVGQVVPTGRGLVIVVVVL